MSKHFGKNSSAQLALYKTRYASWSDLYKNYSAAEADENISNRDDFFRESSWENYWKIYQGLDTPPGFVTQNYPSASMDYPANTQYRLTGFEKSSVLTYNQIQSLLKNDIQMTIINNEFNPNGAEDSSGTGARIQQIKNEMLSDLK